MTYKNIIKEIETMKNANAFACGARFKVRRFNAKRVEKKLLANGYSAMISKDQRTGKRVVSVWWHNAECEKIAMFL